MLVLSTERLIPLGSNDLSLYKEGYYFYLDRATYDSCVILSSRFSAQDIAEEIGREDNAEVIDFLTDYLPHPITIMAPFLALVDTELDMDLEECVKALHIITNTLSLERYIGVSKEIRKSVTFSLSVGDEAELTTQTFLHNALPYDVAVNLMKGNHAPQVPMQQYQQEPVYSAPAPQPVQAPAPVQAVAPTPAPVQVVDDGEVPELDIDSAELEDLRAHPDWEEAGPGCFYNAKLDEVAYVDVPEDAAFEEAMAPPSDIEDEEDGVQALPGTYHKSQVTEEEAGGLSNILL